MTRKTNIYCALQVLLVWAVLVTCLFDSAYAQNAEDAGPKLDAVLLLDASGSMRLTDPLRLREEGAKLLLQFLGEEDQLAVVEFAGYTNVIRPLSPFKKSDLPRWEKDIEKAGDSGLYTDLLTPVKKAHEILKSSGRSDAQPVIILMSDGMMEPDPEIGEARQFTDELLNEVLPVLKEAGIPVYTLYFSDEADPDLLAQVAFATDAINWFTPTAEKIHESYAELFLAIKEPQVIPLTSKGFSVDGDVREATFYISRTENTSVVLQQPDGEKINERTQKKNVRWFRGQRFDVITVTEPEVGNWEIVGIPEQEGFATALTSLRLVVEEWPAAIYPDVPALLQVRLYESDMPVDLPEVADTLRYAFQIIPTDRVSEPVAQGVLRDDGTEGDRIARDGIFSHRVLLDRAGDYQLRIAVEGPTFERHRILPFRVRPRLLNLTVEPPSSEEDLARFQIELSPEALGLRQKEVVLIAIDGSRRRHEIPLTALDARETSFSGLARSLPRDGEYQLQAMLSGRGRANQRIRRESEIVSYERITPRAAVPEPLATEELAEPVIEVKEEPLDEPAEPLPPVWPYVLLLTLANGAVGFLAYTKIKRSVGSSAAEQPEFVMPESVNESLQLLIERSKVKEIQLDDPFITEEPEGESEVFEVPGEPDESESSDEPEDYEELDKPSSEEPSEEDPQEESLSEESKDTQEPEEAQASSVEQEQGSQDEDEEAPMEEDSEKEIQEEGAPDTTTPSKEEDSQPEDSQVEEDGEENSSAEEGGSSEESTEDLEEEKKQE